MKILKNLIFSITALVLVLLLASGFLVCTADSQNGDITVNLSYDNKFVPDGMAVHLSKIADFEDGKYYLSKGFENTEISISSIAENPTLSNAKYAQKLVLQNKVPTLSTVSKAGSAVFKDIGSGIWLVYCGPSMDYNFSPFFVFLPSLNGGKADYNITTSPKVEKNNLDKKSVFVVKKWDDNNNSAKKRPDYVTVELKSDGLTVDTAMLSRDNGWSHTFTGLKNDATYIVNEVAVKNYTAKYDGDMQNGFTITNVYKDGKLPQTGQLWWPVALLLVAGIGFIVLAIVEFGVKKNEK